MRKRRLLFITDPTEGGGGPATPPEAPADPAPEAPAATEDPAPADPAADPAPEGDKQVEDDLPEWARKELTSVRNESASYRTRLREAQAKLADARSPEDFAAAVQELQEKNDALEASIARERVARKHSLPDTLAARLQGATEEELEADAKALSALVVKTPRPAPVNLAGGGLNPSDDSGDDTSPEALVKRYSSRRN